VLGLLPGLDNFSHLGGFATGLLLGIAVMRAPPRIRNRLTDTRSSTVYDLDAPYSSLTGQGASTGRQRGCLGYFKGRKGWWWIWNVIRVACLAIIVVFMALLLNNFYVNGGGHCSWCRYLRYFLFLNFVDLTVVCRLMGGVIWEISRLPHRPRILAGCLFSMYDLHRKGVFYGDFIAISCRSFTIIIYH
jgi:hypothetical protein